MRHSATERVNATRCYGMSYCDTVYGPSYCDTVLRNELMRHGATERVNATRSMDRVTATRCYGPSYCDTVLRTELLRHGATDRVTVTRCYGPNILHLVLTILIQSAPKTIRLLNKYQISKLWQSAQLEATHSTALPTPVTCT